MNVLSLFDGISCGQLVLKKLGVNVENYFASEIDKYAIKVTQHNFPNTVQLGDVYNVKGTDLPKIDLLLGGFPCQTFSRSNSNRPEFDDPRGKLYLECIRLMKECNPKYFLFENVVMSKFAKGVISDAFGVEPVSINANCYSAQNRERLFWTNIPFTRTRTTISDIVFADIVEDIEHNWKEIPKDRSYIIEDYNSPNGLRWVCGIRSKKQGSLPIDHKPKMFDFSQSSRIYDYEGKSPTLATSDTIRMTDDISKGRYRQATPIEWERLQGLPDDFTIAVSASRRKHAVGNGWNVDVIMDILKDM